ncbi:MAG: hypothetical protein ACYC2H_04310 [Thermoplasmatota archaeon]
MQGDLRAGLSFGKAWSSLYIEAESIEIQAVYMEATLRRPNGQFAISEYRPERRVPDGTYDYELVSAAGLLWAIEPSDRSANLGLSLQAQGIHRTQWHNATLDCSTESCLDGAREQGFTTPTPGGWVGGRILPIREVGSADGTIRGSGTPWAVATGASKLTMDVDGWLRLPNAYVEGQCGEGACADPAGRTLQVQGNILLSDMAPLDGQRVTSQFVTSEAVARIDESPPFQLTAGSAWTLAAVSGAAGLLVLFGRPLLGLFARNTRPPEEHPRGKAIHDLILATPGLSFTQIKQATGWAHGSVHHHLQRLLKAGRIVAYSFSKSVHYYENHGRHKHDWKEHAALRKPELQFLHGWIAEHPRAQQIEVIQAMADTGWKRATTQHRLRQLRDAALVTERRTEWAVHYLAVRPHQALAGAPDGGPQSSPPEAFRRE